MVRNLKEEMQKFEAHCEQIMLSEMTPWERAVYRGGLGKMWTALYAILAGLAL